MLIHKSVPILLVTLLVSCATIPSGPSVMALPSKGKTFEQFREDDSYCKEYAAEQTKGQTPNRASILSGLGSAAIATALGAAAGAAFGGGRGAAIGAGSGLVVGGAMGTSSAKTSANIEQQRYDLGYTQCMYGKGHHVPISGQILDESRNPPQGPSPQSLPGTISPPPPPAPELLFQP